MFYVLIYEQQKIDLIVYSREIYKIYSISPLWNKILQKNCIFQHV